jgi:hypothetical protein
VLSKTLRKHHEDKEGHEVYNLRVLRC